MVLAQSGVEIFGFSDLFRTSDAQELGGSDDSWGDDPRCTKTGRRGGLLIVADELLRDLFSNYYRSNLLLKPENLQSICGIMLSCSQRTVQDSENSSVSHACNCIRMD